MMKRAAVAALVLAAACVMVRAVPLPIPVWIDTDPAVGEPDRDVDDGLALLQAFRSPELEIRGVSVVFGNAELARGLPIARRLVRDYGPPRLRVFRGEHGDQRDAELSCRDVFRASPHPIECIGPALIDEAGAAHVGAWKT